MYAIFFFQRICDAKGSKLLNRIEALEKLKTIAGGDNFKSLEAAIIHELLPIVLQRLDDKPKVIDAAKEAGSVIVSKASIQGFLFALPVFFEQMQIESKWKAKVGAIELLEQYMQRVLNEDRDLLSACIPELIPVLGSMIHDTKPEVFYTNIFRQTVTDMYVCDLIFGFISNCRFVNPRRSRLPRR